MLICDNCILFYRIVFVTFEEFEPRQQIGEADAGLSDSQENPQIQSNEIAFTTMSHQVFLKSTFILVKERFIHISLETSRLQLYYYRWGLIALGLALIGKNKQDL